MKLRKKLVHGSLCILVLIVGLSAFSPNVYAQQLVINRYAPYDGAQWYEDGEASASADLDGYHSVDVEGNAYAHAYVGAKKYYTGIDLSKIEIFITIRSADVQKSPTRSWVKFRAWIYDETDGQVIWEKEEDYKKASANPGYCYEYDNQYVNIKSGHTYWFWAGVKAWSTAWWIFVGWAEAYGTVYNFYVCQDTV